MERALPLVDLRAQYDRIQPEIDAAMAAVIRSSGFIGGEALDRFERHFATYCEVPHAVGVANGTDALELILAALGIKAGDEVLVPTMTFAATAEAVITAGAVPVFVDCDPRSMSLDVAATERNITRRTRAIIAVHLYGRPADLAALEALASKHGLALIEDAAQAHGARWQGRRIGGFGVAAAFSFYPGKNLGAYGDGGAVTTRDAALAKKVRMLANHGRTDKYLHQVPGRNSRLDGLQAAILDVKLRHLDEWNVRRREIAALYRKQLGSVVPSVSDDPRGESVHHLFVVQVDHRDRVQSALKAQGIGTGVHYPVPLHRQPAFAGESTSGSWNADRVASRILSLPMYPELSDDDVERVAKALLGVMGD